MRTDEDDDEDDADDDDADGDDDDNDNYGDDYDDDDDGDSNDGDSDDQLKILWFKKVTRMKVFFHYPVNGSQETERLYRRLLQEFPQLTAGHLNEIRYNGKAWLSRNITNTLGFWIRSTVESYLICLSLLIGGSSMPCWPTS